jgi:hypothetical protein
VVKPGENILNFVDGVIDSSRYFVVRIKDPKSTRTTMVGIGFRDREVAFDLKNSLNEYVKFVNRMDLAAQLASTPLSDMGATSSGSGSTDHATSNSLVDYDDNDNNEHHSGDHSGYALSSSSHASKVSPYLFLFYL